MKIRVVELSSGFGNVPNRVVLAGNYGMGRGRDNNAYDKEHIVELPEGFSIAHDEIYGDAIVDADGHIWELGIDGPGSNAEQLAYIFLVNSGESLRFKFLRRVETD